MIFHISNLNSAGVFSEHLRWDGYRLETIQILCSKNFWLMLRVILLLDSCLHCRVGRWTNRSAARKLMPAFSEFEIKSWSPHCGVPSCTSCWENLTEVIFSIIKSLFKIWHVPVVGTNWKCKELCSGVLCHLQPGVMKPSGSITW